MHTKDLAYIILYGSFCPFLRVFSMCLHINATGVQQKKQRSGLNVVKKTFMNSGVIGFTLKEV